MSKREAFVSAAAVRARYDLAPTTLARWVEAAYFPAPAKRIGNRAFWSMDDLRAYEERTRELIREDYERNWKALIEKYASKELLHIDLPEFPPPDVDLPEFQSVDSPEFPPLHHDFGSLHHGFGQLDHDFGSLDPVQFN